jgi:hypothetical protein
MADKQSQDAGDGSLQIQADKIVVIQGVTEARASEIALAKAKQILEEYHAQGRQIADSRIGIFDSGLIAHFAERGLLQVFADPGFQVLLRKAQMQAAVTGTDEDNQLLIQLLAERAQYSKRPIHLAVSKATEAIESLEPDDIMGLTTLWLILVTQPPNSDPTIGLQQRDQSFRGVLNSGNLPSNLGWLDSLAMLDLASVDMGPAGALLNSWKASDDILFAGRAPGYVCKGIAADEAPKLRNRLDAIANDGSRYLVAHEFNPGHYRLDILNPNAWDLMAELHSYTPAQVQQFMDLTVEFDFLTVDEETKKRAADCMRTNFPDTKIAHDWFEDVRQYAFARLTNAGKVLAFSNCQRLGLQGLPPLSKYLGIMT